MMHVRHAVVATIAAVATASCAAHQVVVQRDCTTVDRRLATLLTQLQQARSAGCPSDPRQNSDCTRTVREVEQLATVCPADASILLATATLAHQAGATARAQQYLDRIFEQPVIAPEAAALRGRIALEQGNLPFARRLVEQQARFSPGHAGLQETLAAVLYLAGDYGGARTALQRAQALGAPAWRVAFHLGLIDEASGDREAAARHYGESAAANPDWPAAAARREAISRAP